MSYIILRPKKTFLRKFAGSHLQSSCITGLRISYVISKMAALGLELKTLLHPAKLTLARRSRGFGVSTLGMKSLLKIQIDSKFFNENLERFWHLINLGGGNPGNFVGKISPGQWNKNKILKNKENCFAPIRYWKSIILSGAWWSLKEVLFNWKIEWSFGNIMIIIIVFEATSLDWMLRKKCRLWNFSQIWENCS